MRTARFPRRPAALLLLLPLLSQCGDSSLSGAQLAPRAGSVQVTPAFPALSFDAPLYLTHAPGDAARVFVVTQRGVIYVVANRPDAAKAKVFLDIDERVTDAGGELGLLGLAFDPDYAVNGFFYVNYNPNSGGVIGSQNSTRIARYKVSATDPDTAEPGSETVLLSFNQPFANHNGGWLGFGPDGRLYVATGDGGSAGDPSNNAQNLGNLLGKILRLNRDGSVPPDNPFAGQPTARGEIWAFGLRNPYRCAFDRLTGELWAGDVGQNQWEEIDLIVAGGNYGWRKYEGNHEFNAADPAPANVRFPVHEYEHTGGRCSITGGYPYRGSALDGFAGRYFFADYCSGELWALERGVDGSYRSAALGSVPGNPTSFGEDADGELYLTSFDGRIYKLVPGG